jgi:dTDP-4-amino-4,6-dideoxygalactose transaminase
MIAARRETADHYRRALGNLPGLTFMPIAPYGVPNWWLTCLLVDPEKFGADRDQLLARLARHNIEARPAWKPMHLQPVFAGCEVRGGAVGAEVFATGLCLPSGSSLTIEQQTRVVDSLRAALGVDAPTRDAVSAGRAT